MQKVTADVSQLLMASHEVRVDLIPCAVERSDGRFTRTSLRMTLCPSMLSLRPSTNTMTSQLKTQKCRTPSQGRTRHFGTGTR